MKQPLHIAIVGVTGVVGRTMLEVLAEREFPIEKLYPIASERSAGEFVSFQNEELEILNLEDFDFKGIDIALFSAGTEISLKYAPIAAAANCIVIDNTIAFRYENDVPLVIPEINAERIAEYTKRNIIANPNCSTIQMLVALYPLHQISPITEIQVATYQSVSGTGKAAIDELLSQSGSLLNGMGITPKVYPKQIAFNVIPHIDTILENGYTKEEMKMVWETHKILENDTILVNPTAVRVPVLYGHSEAVHVTFKKPMTVETAAKALKAAPGVQYMSGKKYPTPMSDAVGTDDVYIGRLRQDLTNPCALNLWIVGDNVRKGAATNAVQIAEILHSEYL